jgi:hypothetical protein
LLEPPVNAFQVRSWHIASPVIRQLSASCCQNIDAGRRRRGFEILSHDAMREGMGDEVDGASQDIQVP